MDTLLSLLKTMSPVLATALVGPAGGLVVSKLAEKFGVSDEVGAVVNALTSDPEAALKLAEIDLRQFELHSANTASARDMNTSVQASEHASALAKNAAYIIDFAIVGATLFVTWFLFFKGVPPENKELAYMAFGSLLTLCGTVVNFHRGSSQGSRDKNTEIKSLTQRL